MTKLQRLEIRAFRGIPSLDLDFNGGSIVLGGANGTGKSACVDALEFLYDGTVASLTGTQGLSLRQHGAHIRFRPEQTMVSAQYTDPPGRISRTLLGAVAADPPLRNYLERGERITFLLRRAQLQQFIHAKPADRYRSMAELIGADDLERTETALKRTRDTLDTELRRAQAQHTQIEQQLERLPDDTPSDDQLLAEANSVLAEQGAERYWLSRVEDVVTVRAAVLREVAVRKPDPRLEAQGRLSIEIQRGIGADRLRRDLETYLAVSSAGATDRGRDRVELLQLLRRGREFLKDAHADQCPLCERAIPERQLFSRLVERVAQLEEVGLAEQRLQEARDHLNDALENLASRLRALAPLEIATGRRGPAGSVQDAAAMVGESVRTGALAETREMGARLLRALDGWERWAAETGPELTAEVERAAAGDEATREVAGVLNVLEAFTARRASAERGRRESERLVAERDRLGVEIAQADLVFLLADTTYRTFNHVKNEEIQRIYDELRDDLSRLYDYLHPGEGHTAVALAMDPRKRGSSELRMGFYSRADEDPRAFASEGHLDSLGLCIFLAFARRFNGDWPLLVLDDVVTSVDAGHKRRVAELLFREFGDRQLLITTHDSRWFADLQRAQREAGRSEVRHLIIESWSLDDGPRVRDLAVPTAEAAS